MNPNAGLAFADTLETPDFASAVDSFDLSSASTYSFRHGFNAYHDAPDRLNSSSEDGEGDASGSEYGWSPDKLPAGDRILLLLGSKGCFAATEGIASASTDASIQCTMRPAAKQSSKHPAQWDAEVIASDMMLRVFLEVWSPGTHASTRCCIIRNTCMLYITQTCCALVWVANMVFFVCTQKQGLVVHERVNTSCSSAFQ